MIEAYHPGNQVLNLDPAHGKVVREALGINLGEFAYQRRSDYDRTGEWRGEGKYQVGGKAIFGSSGLWKLDVLVVE